MPGHVRNIHFPFDIEADTAVAVASEMVEELDLTDQDVSAIAAMIDSEIHSLIPDWEPIDITGDNIGEEVPIPDNCASESKNDASPLINQSTSSSANLVLERLPSGRKYWSDSPKGVGGDSPGKSALSNSSSRPDSVTFGDSSSVEGERSPDSLRDGGSLNGSASQSLLEDDCTYSDQNVEEKEGSIPADSQFVRKNGMVLDYCASNVARSLELDCKLLEDVESEDVRIIMVKLERLLVEQQQELDDLKRKHELAVLDLLKELPPEIHHKFPNINNLKISDYRVQ